VNYRHAYHAGNFADVLKHLVMVLVLQHLKQKPGPFRVIDTHAGIGRYDLASDEALRTGEWRDGIGRLLEATLSDATQKAISAYTDIIRAENPGMVDEISAYPGSPAIARHMIRADDVIVANELHPEDAESLKALFGRDRRVKVMSLDGYTALKALLPPKERRGVVLVDPPFEQPGEYDRLAKAVSEAHRRFSSGTMILWYPVKDREAVARFEEQVTRSGVAKTLLIELSVRGPTRGEPSQRGLTATGLLVINPPYTLEATLRQVMPEISSVLAQGQGAGYRIEWLVPEQVRG